MVRQYKIHTDMDNPIKNKIWDVTNGKLRLYEPTNLGIEVGNNLWSTGGIGVLGARAINQPKMEFKLETFGSNLQENYTLLNNFVNDLLSVKYVTLEYQTEWFQVFADIALNEVTKTEGYGQNGTFSEKIVFDIVTKWYTFENLEFKTIENGEIIDGVSKIYGGVKSKMKLPNFNLEKHTRMLVDTSNRIVWGMKGSSTETMTHESVSIPGLPSVKDGVHVTQISKGQSGWRSPSESKGGTYPVISGREYTHSVFIKNNRNTDVTINLQLGTSDSETNPKSNVKFVNEKVIVPANSDWNLYSAVLTIPEGASWAWSYVYTDNTTVTADWSFAGLKVEEATEIDYSRTIVKGAEGTQGTPGKPVADGKTPYFHTAYANSKDGTDRFTTVYPNLNLLTGTKDFSGEDWKNVSGVPDDGTFKGLVVKSKSSQWNGIYKNYTIPEDGDYTFSVYVSASAAGVNPSLTINLNGKGIHYIVFSDKVFDMQRVTYTATGLKKGDVIFGQVSKSGIASGKVSIAGHKWEKSSIATPWMPSSSEVTTADWPKYRGEYSDFIQDDSTNPSDYTWSMMRGSGSTPYLPNESEMTDLDYAPYAGYRYIKNKAYTYYGETHIDRLARWSIDEPFFSFVAKLTPSTGITKPNQDYGLQFLDVNGNEYSAIVFNFETRPDSIYINTDVNDEWYQATTRGATINAFPVLSFSRYRTRIFQKGQMTMKNLSSVEIKVKRKVDFV